jgi:hypothetical protein
MVVKKGNHPPLKVVVSHNDERGALLPEVARLMFDAMGSAPGIQLDLVLLEALRMQTSVSMSVLRVSSSIFLIQSGASMSTFGMSVSSSPIGLSKDRVRIWVGFVNCACRDCRHIGGYKEVARKGNDWLIIVRVGGIVWTVRECVSSV